MDYNSLITDVGTLLNRQDLASNIPGWVDMAEGTFNRDVRHWKMENRATLSTAEQYPALPDDWAETIRLIDASNGKPLDLVSRQVMQDLRENGSGEYETPFAYRHSQSAFEIYPTPTEAISLELEYYQKIPALDAVTTTTNWLIEDHPDIYLYGTALHSAPFLHDDNRLQVWATLFAAAVAACNAASRRSEMSGSSLRMRRRGMTGSARVNY